MTTKKNKKLKDDLFLKPFENEMFLRKKFVKNFKDRITQNKLSLEEFSNAHEYFGLHKKMIIGFFENGLQMQRLFI